MRRAAEAATQMALANNNFNYSLSNSVAPSYGTGYSGAGGYDYGNVGGYDTGGGYTSGDFFGNSGGGGGSVSAPANTGSVVEVFPTASSSPQPTM